VASIIYACGSAVCAGLLIAQYVINVTAVEGFWLIFALFPLCFVYAYWKQRQQQRSLVDKNKRD
jgi:Flp pilus assembly protein TadB